LSASSSKFSIKKLAITGDRCEPMATPSIRL
jgi:hypothetical protein